MVYAWYVCEANACISWEMAAHGNKIYSMCVCVCAAAASTLFVVRAVVA